MRNTIITHCIFQKEESTLLFSGSLGSPSFVPGIKDGLGREAATCKPGQNHGQAGVR